MAEQEFDYIKEYCKEAILFQIFHVERNVFIWKKIGDEFAFLNKQNKEIRDLYSFMQTSALTNIILHLMKVYDTPSDKNSTRCLLSFLNLIENKKDIFPEIVETTNTIKLLNKDAPDSLKHSVDSSDTSLFPIEFSKYYKGKYDSEEIRKKVRHIKYFRDKVIAHNDELNSTSNMELTIVEDLSNFAMEIVGIFGMAYENGTLYGEGKFQITRRDADLNTYFITHSINKLKESGN